MPMQAHLAVLNSDMPITRREEQQVCQGYRVSTSQGSHSQNQYIACLKVEPVLIVAANLTNDACYFVLTQRQIIMYLDTRVPWYGIGSCGPLGSYEALRKPSGFSMYSRTMRGVPSLDVLPNSTLAMTALHQGCNVFFGVEQCSRSLLCFEVHPQMGGATPIIRPEAPFWWLCCSSLGREHFQDQH